MKSVLVTGSAGFIGSALSLKLLESGHNVVGIDNLNEYYSSKLKLDRLKTIEKANLILKEKDPARFAYKYGKNVTERSLMKQT